MTTEITVFEQNGQLLTDSREVAMLIEKEHDQLLRSIRTYSEHLASAKMQTPDFFVESTYIDEQGKTRPCFLCTKRGCDMIANKLTGKKGVLFTAKYVTAFEKMQEFIRSGEQLSNTVPFSEYIKSVDIVASSLRANDASKILMLNKAFSAYGLPTEFLPKYEVNGGHALMAATALLKKNGIGISAVKFNDLMKQSGFLEKRSRNGSGGKEKHFNSLSDAGLRYGENVVSPQNQRETQPLYYEDMFMELFGLLQGRKAS